MHSVSFFLPSHSKRWTNAARDGTMHQFYTFWGVIFRVSWHQLEFNYTKCLAKILYKGQKCWLKSPVIPNVFSSGVCLNNVVSKKSNSNLQRVEIVQQRYQEIKEMLIRHGNHNDFLFKISTAHSKSLGSTDAFCRNSLFQHAFQISSCNHERIVN